MLIKLGLIATQCVASNLGGAIDYNNMLINTDQIVNVYHKVEQVPGDSLFSKSTQKDYYVIQLGGSSNYLECKEVNTSYLEGK